ncbi:coxsackievirus and adenovirus receptor homolog [Corythoichthys intestinalis]|uniref:coxsackievirus and adenovirus receptor homolog n=1 Tax=Corythoichthys intestinalis TaxID=161448 RepID=UPI0025A68F92|nr:coxsackievirus and adenovirus receptor homolog [Corythoichthys intestinalis]XP_057695158.1 coxsackievirus and adenovirus receptor homolog [Corythoichthys intestinalis]XP_061797093.1 coxsackievirus and adenovirus receptor homolog [Nerophis lumbriciformis]
MMMMWHLLWPSVLLGVFFNICPTCPLEIQKERNHYYVARGSSVQLPCAYSHTLDSNQYTEVSWSIVSADREEQPIIWFTGGRLYSDLYKPMEGRVQFTSADPQNGDASITIKDVRLSDMKKYRCTVKKLPELDQKIFDLTVMEAPSQPLCSVDKEDNSMTLKCSSLQGTPPLHYIWSKTSGNKVMPTQAFVDPTGATLHFNITERECGSYRCTVESMVGTKHCDLHLDCSLPQDDNVSSARLLTTTAVAAIVVTITTLFIVAVVLAVFLYRKRKEQHQDIEMEK